MPQLPACGAPYPIVAPTNSELHGRARSESEEWNNAAELETSDEDDTTVESATKDFCTAADVTYEYEGYSQSDAPEDSTPLENAVVYGDIVANKTFSRLLLDLAAEHRRALGSLRAELEAKERDSRHSRHSTDGFRHKGTPGDYRVRCMSPPTPQQINHNGSDRSGSHFVPREGSMKSRLSPFDYVSESMTSEEDEGKASQEESPQLRTQNTMNRGISFARGMTMTALLSLPRMPRTLSALKYHVQSFSSEQLLDMAGGVAILVNAVLVGWAADRSMSNAMAGIPPDEMPTAFHILTVVFTVWFCLELVLRFFMSGPHNFFYSQEWTWNLFDATVVGSDLLQLVVERTTSTGGGVAFNNITVMRILRVLRIIRAIRIVRLVRCFRDFRMMVFSILRSGSSLLCSLVLLSSTIYIFGVYFLQVVAHHLYQIREQSGPGVDDNVEDLREMFGSSMAAQYTLYKAVSGGLNWGEIGEVLIKIDVVHGLVLCFFIFFSTFALLNVITGIFVDSAINCARSDHDEVIQEQLHVTNQVLTDMKRVFKTADKDGNGTITLDEFQCHLESREVRAYLDSFGIEIDKAKGLFQLLDLDHSGEITIEEFAFGCMRLKGSAKSIDLATLMHQQKRMADQLKQFYSWSEQQFQRLHRFELRIDHQLRDLMS